jgi:hypothetical protein
VGFAGAGSANEDDVVRVLGELAEQNGSICALVTVAAP